jgi:hypothetical protein
MKKMKVDREALVRNIHFIYECRETHSYWINAIRAGLMSKTKINISGDIEHHQRCVDGYNVTIKIMESML